MCITDLGENGISNMALVEEEHISPVLKSSSDTGPT